MFDTISRWLRGERSPGAACLEREAWERRELQKRVDKQLADLIAYMDGLSARRQDKKNEEPQ